MLFKLLSLDSRDVINIGDYIQALAASLFLPHVDGFVDREHLDSYTGDVCKVIMNGWFMHNPKHWPPSSQIIPLFIAFHMNSSAQKEMLSEKGVAYLKKYAPIGCRDYYTMQLLQEHGIDSFFSGCLTLALGRKYFNPQKDDAVYFVDPYIDLTPNLKNLISGISTFCFAPRTCLKILKRMDKRRHVKQLLKACAFYKAYRKFFSEQTLCNAIFITQESDYYKRELRTDLARLNEAERLVKLYAKAKLVVTSRIHCALPCLGLKTPVVFTQKKKLDEITSCRYGGIMDLFNCVKFEMSLGYADFKYNGQFIDSDIPSNPDRWEPLFLRFSSVLGAFVKNESIVSC